MEAEVISTVHGRSLGKTLHAVEFFVGMVDKELERGPCYVVIGGDDETAAMFTAALADRCPVVRDYAYDGGTAMIVAGEPRTPRMLA